MSAVVGAIVLSAGMVAAATGGRIAAGAPDTAFDGVTTDSRALRPGALFIALRGPRFDGHRFVADALNAGAAGVLVSEPQSVSGSAVVIEAADTLAALQAIGRDVRRRSGARVVAITGSAGKTTTKELAAAVLSGRYRVFRNPGNLNNHIGLPLSLVELRHRPEIAVVELGMNHEGEIRELVALAEPDVRVWLNVGDAHIGHFASREAIASAKSEVLDGARPGNVAILNGDDPLVMAHAERARRAFERVITFGQIAPADVFATDVIDRGFDGTRARVVTAAGETHMDVALAGRAQLSNALAATAVGLEFGVPLTEIAVQVAALGPVVRRGAITTRADAARIVDDSYNASPAAVRAMLAALASTTAAGRRVAVLGEMLELGQASIELHDACGRAAAASGVDVLVAIGGAPAQALVRGAAASGMPADRLHWFADSVAAAPQIAAIVQPGDLVLVKGSRGTRTDVIADRLIAGGGST